MKADKLNKYLNKKVAFLFEGVGLDYREYVHKFNETQRKELSKLSKRIQEKYDINIEEYLIKGNVVEGKERLLNWMAIYVCDYIVYEYYREIGFQPEIFLGYSLGLTTAIACSAAISFEDGVELVYGISSYTIGDRIKEEAMATIIGLTVENVEEILVKNNMQNDIFIASENNENCIVVSGYKKQIALLENIFYEEGALKFLWIDTPSALHSEIALKDIAPLTSKVNSVVIKQPRIPILSILHKEIIKDEQSLRQEIIANVHSRMYWKDCINKVEELGIDTFIEVGLGNGLTMMSKLINLDNDYLTFDKLDKILHK